MFINQGTLLKSRPIKNMFVEKLSAHGTSYGLTEAGYDIRIQETVTFEPGTHRPEFKLPAVYIKDGDGIRSNQGRFILASAMEVFQMPYDLVGTVRDKSSWARQGISVFNTVIEPGWNGVLTLELVFNGDKRIVIPAGSGIAQVLFGELSDRGDYGNGKYQNAPGIQQAKF